MTRLLCLLLVGAACLLAADPACPAGEMCCPQAGQALPFGSTVTGATATKIVCHDGKQVTPDDALKKATCQVVFSADATGLATEFGVGAAEDCAAEAVADMTAIKCAVDSGADTVTCSCVNDKFDTACNNMDDAAIKTAFHDKAQALADLPAALQTAFAPPPPDCPADNANMCCSKDGKTADPTKITSTTNVDVKCTKDGAEETISVAPNQMVKCTMKFTRNASALETVYGVATAVACPAAGTDLKTLSKCQLDVSDPAKPFVECECANEAYETPCNAEANKADLAMIAKQLAPSATPSEEETALLLALALTAEGKTDVCDDANPCCNKDGKTLGLSDLATTYVKKPTYQVTCYGAADPVDVGQLKMAECEVSFAMPPAGQEDVVLSVAASGEKDCVGGVDVQKLTDIKCAMAGDAVKCTCINSDWVTPCNDVSNDQRRGEFVKEAQAVASGGVKPVLDREGKCSNADQPSGHVCCHENDKTKANIKLVDAKPNTIKCKKSVGPSSSPATEDVAVAGLQMAKCTIKFTMHTDNQQTLKEYGAGAAQPCADGETVADFTRIKCQLDSSDSKAILCTCVNSAFESTCNDFAQHSEAFQAAVKELKTSTPSWESAAQQGQQRIATVMEAAKSCTNELNTCCAPDRPSGADLGAWQPISSNAVVAVKPFKCHDGTTVQSVSVSRPSGISDRGAIFGTCEVSFEVSDNGLKTTYTANLDQTGKECKPKGGLLTHMDQILAIKCTQDDDVAMKVKCKCVNEKYDEACNDPQHISRFHHAASLAHLKKHGDQKKFQSFIELENFKNFQMTDKMSMLTETGLRETHSIRRGQKTFGSVAHRLAPHPVASTPMLLRPGTYVHVDFKNPIENSPTVQIDEHTCHRLYVCQSDVADTRKGSLCTKDTALVFTLGELAHQGSGVTWNAGNKQARFVLAAVGPQCSVKITVSPQSSLNDDKHSWKRFTKMGESENVVYPLWNRFYMDQTLIVNKKAHSMLIEMAYPGKLGIIKAGATAANNVRKCIKKCGKTRTVVLDFTKGHVVSEVELTMKVGRTCRFLYACFDAEHSTDLESATAGFKPERCKAGHDMELLFDYNLVKLPASTVATRFEAHNGHDVTFSLRFTHNNVLRVHSSSTDTYIETPIAVAFGRRRYFIAESTACIDKFDTSIAGASENKRALGLLVAEQPTDLPDVPDPADENYRSNVIEESDLVNPDFIPDVYVAPTSPAATEAPTIAIVDRPPQTEAKYVPPAPQSGVSGVKNAGVADAYLLWSGFVGLVAGMMTGLVCASLFGYMCRRALYKDWYRSMYSRYGSSATTASATEANQSMMTGTTSMMGGTTAGGSTMGGTTAGDGNSTMGCVMGGTTAGGTTAGGSTVG